MSPPGDQREADDYGDKEEFYDCFEERHEEQWRLDSLDVVELEQKAKRAKREKDFSYEMAAQLIKDLACHGSSDRHRQRVPKA